MLKTFKISLGLLLITQSQQVLSYTQNIDTILVGNNTKNIADAKWIDRIKISGLMLGEVIVSSHNQQPSTRFNERRSYSTFCIPRANLLIDADIDKGLSGHFSFNLRHSCGYGNKNDPWSFTKFGITDEAYLTYRSPAKYPAYINFGIQYMPFGTYKRHQIPATLTQALTQIQAPGIVFGITGISNYHFAGFIFNGKKSNKHNTTQINNFGGRISYHYNAEDADLVLTLDAINNIANSVNYLVSNTQNPLNTGYNKIVPGLAFNANLKSGKWVGTLQIATALRKFATNEIIWKDSGAKPGAFLISGGYKLNLFKLPTNISCSYQVTRQAVNLQGNNYKKGLPKRRIQANYTVDVMRNLTTGLHLVFDRDFKAHVGGTGKNNLTGMLSVLLNLA